MPYAGSITPLDNGACKTTKEWEQDNNIYGIGAFLINTDDWTFKVADGIKTYAELEIYIIKK